MKVLIALPIFLFLCSGICYAQDTAAEENAYKLPVWEASTKMLLDGVLDEPAWQEAKLASGFFQNFPMDSAYATLPTEVRMAFDEAFLYIGATVYQNRADYIITSLKRDFEDGGSDELHGAANAGLMPLWATWFLDQWPAGKGSATMHYATSRFPRLRAPNDLLPFLAREGRKQR